MYIRVINLDTRLDRYQNMISIISNSVLKNYWLKRFSAINGYNLKEDLINKGLYDDPIISILRNLNQEIKCGELGAMLSHYFVLREIMEDESLKEDDLILITEDDFILGTDFDERFPEIVREIKGQEFVNVIYVGGRFEDNFEPEDYSIFEQVSAHIYLRDLFKIFQANPTAVSIDDILEPRTKNYDRTNLSYMVRKRIAPSLINYIQQFLILSRTFLPVDTYMYGTMKPTFDIFPHLFYSIINSSDSNIQNENRVIHIKTSDL